MAVYDVWTRLRWIDHPWQISWAGQKELFLESRWMSGSRTSFRNCRIGITLLFIENAWWDGTSYIGGSSPFWINSEYIKISLYTVYTVIQCIYGHIRHMYGIWKSHIRSTLVIILPPPSPWHAAHIFIIPCLCEADERAQGADCTLGRGGPSCLLIRFCPVVPHVNQDRHPLNILRRLFWSFPIKESFLN